MHLSQLLNGGFVSVRRDGRHRYYQITSSDVAHAIEALGVLATPRKRKPIGEDEATCHARTCYDHLAGKVAVRLAQVLEGKGLLIAQNEREYEVTASGRSLLCRLAN